MYYYIVSCVDYLMSWCHVLCHLILVVFSHINILNFIPQQIKWEQIVFIKKVQYYNIFELAWYMYMYRKLFTTVTSLSHTKIHIWDNRDLISFIILRFVYLRSELYYDFISFVWFSKFNQTQILSTNHSRFFQKMKDWDLSVVKFHFSLFYCVYFILPLYLSSECC